MPRRPVVVVRAVETNARAVGKYHHQVDLALLDARNVGGEAL